MATYALTFDQLDAVHAALPAALRLPGRGLIHAAAAEGYTLTTTDAADAIVAPIVAEVLAGRTPAPPADELALLIKAECGRRIYAVVSDNAQKNTLANVLAGTLTGADLDTWKAGVAWIAEMQATARTLTTALDPTYAQDAHWPEVPAGVAELAARF